MTAPEVSDDSVLTIEAQLIVAVDEARSLRFTGSLPDAAVGLVAVWARLQLVRANLDRVEELLGEVSRFRTGARVLLKEASARVDDRWAERVSGGRGRPGFGGSEIDGPRERYARADVAVVGDRIVARQRERVFDAVQDAHAEIDRIRRGLDAVRMDLHALVRVLSAPENRMDRTDG
jgi:hypothetical protein